MSCETGFDLAQSETERLAFLLSCYDVWSASRADCGEAGADVPQEDGE